MSLWISYPTRMNPNATLGQLRTMYEAGSSLQDISDWTGIPSRTVRGRLIQIGVVMRPKGGARKARLHPDVRRRTLELYESGMVVRLIAKEMGVTEVVIYERLKGLPITRRRPTMANVSASDYHAGGWHYNADGTRQLNG